MKQKRKHFNILLILSAVAAICLSLHFTINPTIIRKSDDTAVKIAESYLAKQPSLRDYEVAEAHFYETRSGERYVSMTYSVQPRKTAFKNWYAGNGEIGNDGWLIEKYGLIVYRMVGPIAVTGVRCNTGP